MVASYEVPLLQALDTQPLKSDFVFQSAAMNFRSAGGGICEVVVDIPVGGLTFEENKQAGYFDGKLAYVAVVKDADGQVVKKLRQEVPLRVTPDKLAAYKASSHFIYDEGVNLGPGSYTLETAVLDMPSQKLSAKKASFVVPAPSDSARGQQCVHDPQHQGERRQLQGGRSHANGGQGNHADGQPDFEEG